MNDLSDWLEHIESFHPSEIELGLDRIKQVAEKLDLLSIAEKVILVTGTNGKGSCVAMLESLSLTQGKKVGSYTSPHLIAFNERIRINGENADDQALVFAFQQIEKQRAEIKLTFFEFTTLAALYLFKSAPLDIVILEIGLGGRHDATNIIEPNVSIITTIDKDHASWLGDDLESIAYEKGGIIRSDTPCFTGDEKSYNLLNKVLPEYNSEIQLVEPATQALIDLLADNKINPNKLLAPNILLANTAFEKCFDCQLTLSDIAEALSNIVLNGRFQRLNLLQDTIVDVAHNPQSAQNLAYQIAEYKKRLNIDHLSVICGMMADKAIDQVLQIMEPVVDHWCFVDLDITRAISADGLLTIYCQVTKKTTSAESPCYQCFASVEDAYNFLVRESHAYNSSNNPLILVFGSFITVANMLQYEQTNSQNIKLNKIH